MRAGSAADAGRSLSREVGAVASRGDPGECGQRPAMYTCGDVDVDTDFARSRVPPNPMSWTDPRARQGTGPTAPMPTSGGHTEAPTEDRGQVTEDGGSDWPTADKGQETGADADGVAVWRGADGCTRRTRVSNARKRRRAGTASPSRSSPQARALRPPPGPARGSRAQARSRVDRNASTRQFDE